MKNVGKQVGALLKGGDIVLLYGELGSGKSTLVKGIAEVLGVKETTNSPTFTIMNVYDTKKDNIKKLVHVDTYRLKDQSDLDDIGIDEYMYDKDSICIFEWPDKLKFIQKDSKPVKITIEYLDTERRKIVTENLG
jgi:tRNA threonylcarbamoyladenosine biosynthesis protein TsaE